MLGTVVIGVVVELTPVFAACCWLADGAAVPEPVAVVVELDSADDDDPIALKLGGGITNESLLSGSRTKYGCISS